MDIPDKTPEPVVTPTPIIEVIQNEEENNNTGVLLLLILAVLIGGTALYYIKFIKSKSSHNIPKRSDEFDFDDMDDDM